MYIHIMKQAAQAMKDNPIPYDRPTKAQRRQTFWFIIESLITGGTHA